MPQPIKRMVSNPTEADTCRKYVVPKLQKAGWDTEPHSIAEQRGFTNGRIVVAGTKASRLERKKADYLLRYTPDFMIAVVEAKAEYKLPADGLQQAKEYAQILGLKYAYSTNGVSIVEFDFTTGQESELAHFPTPAELWNRYASADKLDEEQSSRLLTPFNNYAEKPPRYYQEIAINRAVKSILQGNTRNLLTMATGTGKTSVAFQICWKLWSSSWNRDGRFGKPRILFLADRNILVDDPKDKDFIPFGDARMKIENGEANKSRQMYFAIYQAIAKDERRPGLYTEFGPDFFDLIVIDECHRGSAADDSNWREILDYFSPAYQLGMTATPLRDDNRDTYQYFGRPLYTYSLRQGIEDGFLAPYRVHRILTTVDAVGWRPEAGQTDRFDHVIPDRLYTTVNFEKDVVHDYLARAERAGLKWPLPDDWGEEPLNGALFGGEPVCSREPLLTQPDFALVHEQRQKSKHITLQLLWEEYRAANPEGYRYSRFCELYQRWSGRRTSADSRVNHGR